MRFSTALFLAAIALLYGVFGTILVATGGLVWLRDFYGPSIHFRQERGRDALKKDCHPTTDWLQDLIVTDDIADDEAVDLAVEHGVAVVPSVLTKKTAQKFRDYVMQKNKEMALSGSEQVYVQQKEHRYNLVPDVKEPIVQKVLKQVAKHKRLRPLLDKLVGTGASLTNLSVLTVEYGAKDQSIHTDTGTSFATHPDEFVPEYSLVLALQDTTEEMGVTHLCPGTQFCRSVAMAQGEDPDAEIDMAEICDVHATLNQGDGFLFLSDVFHRGMAHTDCNAPERAFVFLTFAESRQNDGLDRRLLPFGQVRALHWSHWGHVLDDLADVASWKWWHALFPKKNDHGIRPWTFVDNFLTMFENGQNSIAAISNDFNREYFEKMVDLVFVGSCFVLLGLVYWVVLPLMLLMAWRSGVLTSHDKRAATSQEKMDGAIVPDLIQESKKLR